MDERRNITRQRVLKTGAIEFGGSAIDCTVRNLSKIGAALDVPSPVGIPDKFDLVIPYRCAALRLSRGLAEGPAHRC